MGVTQNSVPLGNGVGGGGGGGILHRITFQHLPLARDLHRGG